MTKYLRRCTFLSFSLLLGAPDSTWGTKHELAGPGSEITVRIYNYAAVSEQQLARAQRHAATVFAKAGLEPNWLHCRLSSSEAIKDAACEEPLGATDVVLQIIPREMATHLELNDAVCGFALPGKGKSIGFATIFYHRVQQLVSQGSFSADRDSTRALVFGHIIAHEIGHLLLGKGSHASRGLMSFPWNQKELKNANWGGLVFSRRQKRRIRDALLKRTSSPQEFP